MSNPTRRSLLRASMGVAAASVVARPYLFTISSKTCRKTCGSRARATSNNFLIAYGGQDLVTKDGKLHLDNPKVREAAIQAITYPATAYKEGFVPPSAINWNDADDNN